MSAQSAPAPRRSLSAVSRVERASVPPSEAAPLRSLSGSVNASAGRASRLEPRRLSLNERLQGVVDGRDRTPPNVRRSSFHQAANASGELSGYYAFSRRKSSSVVNDDEAGLSGFLEYRKLDGSWRPFLFQTIGYQLVVFRVHVTHQVQIMSTDVREATEIALFYEGPSKHGDTRLFRLGVNDTLITLRAVSHHAALYWVEGLQQLKAGILPDIVHDRPTIESEEDIFRQIDQMTFLREWRPPPSEAPACGLCCLPIFGRPKRAETTYPLITSPGAPVAAIPPRPEQNETSSWCKIC